MSNRNRYLFILFSIGCFIQFTKCEKIENKPECSKTAEEEIVSAASKCSKTAEKQIAPAAPKCLEDRAILLGKGIGLGCVTGLSVIMIWLLLKNTHLAWVTDNAKDCAHYAKEFGGPVDSALIRECEKYRGEWGAIVALPCIASLLSFANLRLKLPQKALKYIKEACDSGK